MGAGEEAVGEGEEGGTRGCRALDLDLARQMGTKATKLALKLKEEEEEVLAVRQP